MGTSSRKSENPGLTEKVYTHLDMQVLVDAINKTLEDEDSVTADTKSA